MADLDIRIGDVVEMCEGHHFGMRGEVIDFSASGAVSVKIAATAVRDARYILVNPRHLTRMVDDHG